MLDVINKYNECPLYENCYPLTPNKCQLGEMKKISDWYRERVTERKFKAINKLLQEIKIDNISHLKVTVMEAIYYALICPGKVGRRYEQAKSEYDLIINMDKYKNAAMLLSQLAKYDKHHSTHISNSIFHDASIKSLSKNVSIKGDDSHTTYPQDSADIYFNSLIETIEQTKTNRDLKIDSYYCVIFATPKSFRQIKKRLTIETALTLYITHRINLALNQRRANVHGMGMSLINGQLRNVHTAALVVALATGKLTAIPRDKSAPIITTLKDSARKSWKDSGNKLRIKHWGSLVSI